MKLARTFRSRIAAESHLAALVTRYALPRHYSRRDLEDGTLVEYGGGRHVPPENLVREPVPPIQVSPTGKTWAVESTESERADPIAAAKLTEHDLKEWKRLDDRQAKTAK